MTGVSKQYSNAKAKFARVVCQKAPPPQNVRKPFLLWYAGRTIVKLGNNGVAQCDHATLGQGPRIDAFRGEFHERVHAADWVYMGNEVSMAAAH